MKINSLAVLFAIFVQVGVAYADRQAVVCKGGKGFEGFAVSLSFNPDKAIDTIWKKDKTHGAYIQTIKLGERDTRTATTARLAITVPSNFIKAPYNGKFPLTDFYEVNIRKAADSGYSYKFNGQGYRSFHGHDENQRWDMMFYFPEMIESGSASKFNALTTIQFDMMDQGYYHIDLVCSSKSL